MTAAIASPIDADFLVWLEDVMAQLSAATVAAIDKLPQPLNLAKLRLPITDIEVDESIEPADGQVARDQPSRAPVDDQRIFVRSGTTEPTHEGYGRLTVRSDECMPL